MQSEASFKATLAQFEAGRVSFLGALEALNGWVGDQGAYLQTLAQLQAQHIALAEAGLGPAPGIAGGSLGAASIASGSGTPAPKAPSKAAKAADSAPASMKM